MKQVSPIQIMKVINTTQGIHDIRIKYEVKYVLLFYAVGNGMGVLKNSNSVKPLREVTGIINPIYAGKNTNTTQQPTQMINVTFGNTIFCHH